MLATLHLSMLSICTSRRTLNITLEKEVRHRTPSGIPVSNVARPWQALAPCTTTALPTTRPTSRMVHQNGSCVQNAQRGEDDDN